VFTALFELNLLSLGWGMAVGLVTVVLLILTGTIRTDSFPVEPTNDTPTCQDVAQRNLDAHASHDTTGATLGK
jgi:hypothetical protein